MFDEIMDLRNAAKFLHLNERTVWHLVKDGKIPGIKLGGQWRFSKKCLEEMFSKRSEENIKKLHQTDQRKEKSLMSQQKQYRKILEYTSDDFRKHA